MARTPDEIRAAYALGRPERSDDQELLNVGQTCHYEKCDLVSYLTFKCQYCNERHCDEHKAPEGHECEKWDPLVADRKVIECTFLHPSGFAKLMAGSSIQVRCARVRYPFLQVKTLMSGSVTTSTMNVGALVNRPHQSART